jgi:hypothetical protein
MKAFAHFIVKRSVAWAVVIIVLAITGLSAIYANRVVQDDDVLAFLPKQNKEVASFYEVAGRFGGLDIALVGIESDDVFITFLGRLKTLTRSSTDQRSQTRQHHERRRRRTKKRRHHTNYLRDRARSGGGHQGQGPRARYRRNLVSGKPYR